MDPHCWPPIRTQPLHISDALLIDVHGVQPGLLIPGRGQDDAGGHRQLQSMAELLADPLGNHGPELGSRQDVLPMRRGPEKRGLAID